MSENASEKNDASQRWSIPRWWAILLLLLGGFALFGERGVLNLYQSFQARNRLQVQVDQLKRDNARLQAEIKALRDDPLAIERAARERLGMVRPGEVVYQFSSPEAEATSDALPAADADVDR